MGNLCLMIGGIHLSVSSCAEVDLLSVMPQLNIFRCHYQPRACHIAIDSDPTAPSTGETLFKYILSGGKVGCEMKQRSEHLCFTMNTCVPPSQALATVNCHTADNSAQISIYNHEPQNIAFALWIAYSTVALSNQCVPIHASAIVHNGKATLFLGESGTGKSTHSALWIKNIAGSRLLNDDSPIITIGGSTPMVHGSPWSGKSDCYRQEAYPVGNIVRIVRAQSNHIARLNIPEAMAAVVPSMPPALMWAPTHKNILTHIAAEIVQRVPIWRLYCLPNDEAALLCHKSLSAI